MSSESAPQSASVEQAIDVARQSFMAEARKSGSSDRADGDDSDVFAITEVELLNALQPFQDALITAVQAEALPERIAAHATLTQTIYDQAARIQTLEQERDTLKQSLRDLRAR